MQNARQPLTVSDLTRKIKQILESGFPSIAVQGEISNFKRHSSGHLYFTLKDEGAQLPCVMWRSRAATLPFVPEDGMKVIAGGRISVYEVRGSYQLDAQSIRQLGAGELQAAFEKLKEKLGAEGLFDPGRKRPLPRFPHSIGIVTSPTGAVLQDIRNVIGRRFPGVELILNPVRVQGSGAAPEIAAALDDFSRFGRVDIVLLARGGGSLEDLWPFNEEVVARAIARSRVPVVSAVGHETDFTIADFVADLRAPTPSAAAEIVVPDRRELLENVADSWYRIEQAVLGLVSDKRERIHNLLNSYAFNRPVDLLRQHSQHVDEVLRALHRVAGHAFALTAAGRDSLEQRLRALDPRLALKRGYAIVRKQGAIVSSASGLHPRDRVDVEFRDGTVRSTID
ncbi:MAG TPA: exodeoxyribonuclease VII large subunit [Bacteroidota bacterium]|nr:exodeoxyribonuclease VII large subunit [Bacteroidota bacterium]